ncbi:LacI family DNA-binding transcriptional regulator [Mesorhizobium sp. BAC0120]|uniref:LacI family DNA-binding transcriptional regulator n=1 Tax=Mesorhizobium sp. BAC0120 TaxID=3090670 RepID=UPI00298D51B2|nr:LacI family DNA-binding transcriptional regulator [Mesorhizobium sp. BAC0120]MDW6024057.1 LacI family DNA-binding transcriptional regulator [Mesorhizobium sp. BAC0120]
MDDETKSSAEVTGPERLRPTIRDVARHAGVSIGTVSKALNKGGNLALETRERIIAVAKELGFRPNSLAQSLHRKQSFTVGLISTDSFGRFTMPIMEGLEECLTDRRMQVFMCNATDDPALEAQHVESLLGKRVDGLVVTARRADKRPPIGPLAHGLPIVYVFSHADDPDALSLLPDDEGGAVLAVQHLAELGRKRIAHITGPEHFEAVRLRRAGYFSALAAARLPRDDAYYLPGVWSEAWGREAVARLLDGRVQSPDALFCGNDQIARGAADALRERGLDVPSDVAIVGFDNWDVMTLAARPPLTSIDMNLKALGREAGERLIDMISGEKLGGLQRRPCSLVVRESTGR